ncbi:baseplate assembly protein [Leptolyngbya sp. AN02str]|uniref:baseplate assembly protein n=1 Tax=Leptolyngbya sp. AN02str TaxID=3423363 RepID=UPI003D31DCEE
MANLPQPNFVERDPAQIETAVIALWETITGTTLYPAQVERLWLDLLVYQETLIRIAAQYTAEQELVNYAVGNNLDQLGELVDTPRLQAAAAQMTLQFTKNAINSTVLVPAGTRAQAQNGVAFATDEDLVIAPGSLTGTAIATCEEAGLIGNDFAVGQVNQFVDAAPTGITTVSSTTISAGGSEVETDEPYRERIKLAPNGFTTAGSKGQYRYLTRRVSPLITNVAVTSPKRSHVNVYPLLTTGLPSVELLAAVEEALNAEDARPLCDVVSVLAPTEVSYQITAEAIAYSNADLSLLQSQLTAVAEKFAVEKRANLGQDVPRSQVVAALGIAGVYSISLTSPVADLVVAENEWANCTAINVTISGTNDG